MFIFRKQNELFADSNFKGIVIINIVEQHI
jgi:hypothetical protein